MFNNIKTNGIVHIGHFRTLRKVAIFANGIGVVTVRPIPASAG
jgi:hypothetical protein